MAGNSYWQERFLKDKARSINLSEKYIKGKLKRYYTDAAKEIETEIESFYEKYAKDEKISLSEARKKISAAQFDRRQFEKTAKEVAALRTKYGKDIPEGIAKQIEEQERLLNTLSKKGAVTRLQGLHASIDNAILKLYDKQQMTLYDMLKDGYEDGYYRGMFRIQQRIGIGIDFTRVNERAVRQAVLANHSKGNFSSTLYKHSKTLSKDLQENLTIGIIRGESVDEMAKRISRRLGVSMSNAKRLVRTETAYIHEMATLESYKEAGIIKYRFLATLDNNTSEICRSLDKQEFEVEKAMPGENCPPMHPNCRSTTEAVFEDEIESTRIARAEDGSQYMVPRDMNYEEWKEKYVDSVVENVGNSGIIKSIDIDDFELLTAGKGIEQQILDTIYDVIQKFETTGQLYISELFVGSLGTTDDGIPVLQIEPMANGLNRLNINADLLSSYTYDELNQKIANTKKNVARSLEEAVVHECGHAKLIRGMKVEEIKILYKELEEKGVSGISLIAEQDGVECIAEIEVLLHRGETISQEALELYNKYVKR